MNAQNERQTLTDGNPMTPWKMGYDDGLIRGFMIGFVIGVASSMIFLLWIWV